MTLSNEFKKQNAYLIKNAEKGDMDAQYALGDVFYNEGAKVESLYWFQRAADQDHIKARYRVADHYAMEGDQRKADHLFQKLVDEGFNLQTISKSFYLDPFDEQEDDLYLM